MKAADIDPRTMRLAQISVERDLSVLVGPELIERYSATDASRVFEVITGKSVGEVAVDHNPFWHYMLQTWYKAPRYRAMLHPPRHRDEVCRAVVLMATGKLDKYDGVAQQYPRRALKSTFMKGAADWLPKRHKIVDNLDILLLYSHNLERRATGALETIKNINRYNKYILAHFGDGCQTLLGKNASFVIPKSEWGEKAQWNWPCRELDFNADEKNMTGEAALSRKAGAGYNYRFVDDWESEESRDSEIIREQLADRYDQLRQLNAPPFSREWVAGTPYHIQSLYRPMMEEKHEDGTPRYWTIFMPALTDGKPNFPTIPKLSVESIAKERANEIKRRGTDRFVMLQYQLDATNVGDQSMSWDYFIPLTPTEFAKKFGNLPKFRAIYCDPAWKGDDNHQEGCDAAIGTIDSYSIAGQIDNVLLDLHVSNDMESDEGADEMLRQMRVWHTHFYSCEQQADKSMVGLMKRIWKSLPRESRPTTMPRFIDVKSWNKRAKNDRISTVAAHAKTGHWYYLTTVPETHLSVLRKTANEYPASVKRDALDMMAQSHADEILARWVPIAIPESVPDREREQPVFVTRYTGLTPIFVH